MKICPEIPYPPGSYMFIHLLMMYYCEGCDIRRYL